MTKRKQDRSLASVGADAGMTQSSEPTPTVSELQRHVTSRPRHITLIDRRTVYLGALVDAIERLVEPACPIERFGSIDDWSGRHGDDHDERIQITLIGGLARDEWPVAISRVRARVPDARIVLLLDRIDASALQVWKEHHPAALLPSTYTPEQLVACLDLVLEGGRFIPPETIDELLASQGMRSSAIPGELRAHPETGCISNLLTPRQIEVMRHVAMGRANKYIAAELGLCESTVKVHVSELMRRLGATSRTHAAWLISEFKFVESDNN